MSLLNLIQKYKSLKRKIKGMIFNYIFFGGNSKNLKISDNVDIWGKIKLGNNIYFGSGVKIYKNNIIEDNVYLGDYVELRCNGKNRINIGKNTTINKSTLIMGTVNIENDCLIAPLCVIVGSNHNFSDINNNINKQGLSSKGIHIKENTWIGAKVTILDGVTIGENSIIGAGTIVTKDIPRNSIVIGNPAKIIKTRT